MNSEEEGLGVYLVRAHCATYNHSMYITDALNGFVMQKTNFPFICTIVDDASTDGEQGVINDYVDVHFDHSVETGYKQWETEDAFFTFARHKKNERCHFVVLCLKKNLYKNPRKRELIKEWCKTKYIALCEGDDYWTDPLKLQKQVDYMESHPDCCMCSHKVDWEMDGSLYKGGCQHENSCDLTTDEVIRNGGLYLATNSLVYRKWLDEDQPEWRKKAMVGDYPLQILAALRGKIHFISDTMSVYRYQSSGSWTTQRSATNSKSQERRVSHAKNKVLWMGLLDKDTEFSYTKAIYSSLFADFNVLYNAGEIGFGDYLGAVRRADEKHYRRVIKDFLIRNGNLPYKLWKKYILRK